MEYGLIGEKLVHSYSPYIHNELNNKNYILMELSKNNLHDFMLKKDFKGINVTIPYKEEVIKYIDNIDEAAKRIGAVNTIVNKNDVLYGYNTDYYGLISLINVNNIKINHKKVLILGTGGTSKTAKFVCENLGALNIIKASRNNLNDVDTYTYEEVYEKYNDVEIIINTTPVGMYSASDITNIDKTPIDLDKFKNVNAIIDIVYNPLNTKLIKEAENKGIKAVNGLYMLVSQAVYANNLFFDKNEDNTIIEEKTNIIYKKLLNKTRNIVLIGMPGCGKTKVGKELASKMNKEFFDLDVVFKEKYGLLAGEYIEKNGEEDFRERESIVVCEVSNLKNIIISTGGGVVLREKNIDMLKRNGVLVFIDRNIDNIKPTITRPLTNDREKLKKVYETRYPLYTKYADLIIKTNEVIEDTVNRIINFIND